jgi:hypothetical protein
MDIYNALPNELQLEIDSYIPEKRLIPILKRRNEILRAAGTLPTDKQYIYGYEHIPRNYKEKTYGRNCIYDLSTERGRLQYKRLSNAWENLIERTTKDYGDKTDVTLCCMKKQHKHDIVHCPNGHPYCRYKKRMFRNNYQIIQYHYDIHYCRVCRKYFEHYTRDIEVGNGLIVDHPLVYGTQFVTDIEWHYGTYTYINTRRLYDTDFYLYLVSRWFPNGMKKHNLEQLQTIHPID